MLLTRDILNKDIKFHDYAVNNVTKEVTERHYEFNEFSSLVDAYKNLFLNKGAVPGQSVIIGVATRIEQLALTLACAELGLIVTIVGGLVVDPSVPERFNEKVGTKDLITDTFRSILPIDWFVVLTENCTRKFDTLKEYANNTILLKNETLDYTANNKILARPDGAFLKCTSSGTTGTPKIILHSHKFFTALIHRNSKMFYGKMGLLDNLNHGSSPGTYFLPALVSPQVTDFYSFVVMRKSPITVAELAAKNNLVIDHLMVPYTQLIDEFFDSNLVMPECILYTLGIIRKNWVERLPGKLKDIISIFGSNETSGPLFINRATDPDFAENGHTALDDFYELIVNKDCELEIRVPVYDKIVPTKDIFNFQNGKYYHGGRSNLFRINDLEINNSKYQEIVDKYMKAELVIDTNKDRIYLAVWEPTINEAAVKQIDDLLRQNSDNRHYISKYLALKQESFMSGIKLNREFLREYFRKNM